jgi:hypothetical protein
MDRNIKHALTATILGAIFPLPSEIPPAVKLNNLSDNPLHNNSQHSLSAISHFPLVPHTQIFGT